MKHAKGQIVTAPSGGRYVPNPLPGQCPRCGARPMMDATSFFDRWLPANQHASDSKTRAVVEATFPFEFRCYESWGVAMYVKFVMPPSPEGMETPADALAGKRFGPFQCFCEANGLVEKWFKIAVGDDPLLANLYPAMRAIVENTDCS